MKSFTAVITLLAWLSPVSTMSAQQRPKDYSGNCTDSACHAGLAQRPFVHGPVSVNSCEACHVVVSKQDHRFRLTSEGAALCSFCHLERHAGSVRHQPEAEGQCVACHDPHGSDAKFFLKAATVEQLCKQCHLGTTDGMAFLHGPVAAGSCLACHDAHASDHDALLFAARNEFCTKCHTDIKTQLAGRAYVHGPVNSDCTACHNAHGAADRMLLSAPGPQACLNCHKDMAERIANATVKHDAVMEGQACAACHDPHASDFEHILRVDAMDLCMTCHDKPLDTPHGKIADLKKLFADNPSVHGPIAQRQCSGCHETHGGTQFRMLTMAYPEKFYSPYQEENYALCFECHEPDLVRTERTDRLTNFRNGDQNLHYLHVNRDKGRTCRACHEVHASRNPKHISDSVPFGNWSIPINYEQTNTGGTCQPGCHKPYGYDRGTPVMNLSDASGGK